MNGPPAPVPLFRIMLGNATLLSVAYLAIGVTFELVRRVHPTTWVMRAALVLDSLPARTLEILGWLEPLRHAYVFGQISETTLRLIFSATTLAIIFMMAVVVGTGMWLVRRFLYRRYT